MYDVLGHIRDPFPVLQELYRVAKPNAQLIVRGIHYASDRSDIATYRDVAGIFTCFGQPSPSGENSCYSADWLTKRVKMIVLPHLQDAEVQFLNCPLKSFARDMVIQLEAIKPRRPRKIESSVWPAPTLASALVDDEISF
jgi:hypothetical protein